MDKWITGSWGWEMEYLIHPCDRCGEEEAEYEFWGQWVCLECYETLQDEQYLKW